MSYQNKLFLWDYLMTETTLLINFNIDITNIRENTTETLKTKNKIHALFFFVADE